jgi:fibronectin-binding autotransporter adhesin
MKHVRTFLVLVVCAASLTVGRAWAQSQLVTNGTFNSPPGGTNTSLSASSTTLTGWTVDYTAPQNNGIAFGTTFGTPGLASTQSVQLASGSFPTFKEGGIQQAIATIPGQAYSFTIYAKDERGVINSTGATVSFGGQIETLNGLNKTTFVGFTWQETATASSTLLDIIGNSSNLDAVVVSDLSVTLVQVPTIWSGSASTAWGLAANWSPSNVPNNPSVAVTFGTAGANSTVDIGAANRTVGIVNFVKTVPTTIISSSGNYLILDDTGGSSASATINVSGNHAISAPILLNSPAAFNISSGTDQIVVSGVMASGGSGPQGLSLAGSGTLTLAAANTFSGPTNVASGTLLLSNSAALQNSTLSSGGVAFSPSVVPRAFTLGGLSGNGGIALADTSGDAIVLSMGGNSTNTTYSGVLSGGGSLTKIGSGTLTLAGANTFSGNTLIGSGTLAVGNAAALQNSVLDTSGGGVLSLGSQTSVTLGGLVNGGGLNLVNAASQAVNLTLGNGQNLTYPGAISGAGGSVTMNGAAMQVLSGNNSYGGGSNVTAGTLQFQGSGALPPGTIGGGGNGVFSLRLDGGGNGGTINVPDNITLTVAGVTNGLTIDVGSLSGGRTGTTVSFGTLSNGTPANALNSAINFTAANGYIESFAGLNLPGATGYSTVLNPTTTTVAILGNVVNQMTAFSGAQYDTLILDGTSSGNTIYGAISDASNSAGVGYGDTRLTKSNGSQWILAGSNSSYSGPTLISGGTLQLGTGRNGQDGTLGQTSGVTNSAALVYNYFGSVNAQYSIAGTGSVTMVGPGSVILANSNSYTGATSISSGTLALGPGGSISQSSLISLNAGATLDVSQITVFELAGGQSLAGTGNYTVSGAITADSGSTILPGAAASAGTLNVGGLTLSPGSTLSYDLGLGGGKNLVNVTGAFGGLTLNGGGVFLSQTNGSTFSTPGTYLLMDYGSGNSIAGSPSNLSVLNPSASNTYSFTATGGSLDLTIGTPNVWSGGANPSFLWSKANNWSTGHAPVNNNSVMFAGTTGLNNTNDISGLSLAAIFFSSTAGTFNISGNSIQLGGPIVNNGTAAQTLGLNITLTGENQNITAAAGNIVLNGVIDDAGAGLAINVNGSHTVVLGGANTFSGTTAAAGPILLANPLALQDSTLNLLPGGSLSFAASNTTATIAGLSGSGSVTLTTSTGQPVALAVGGSYGGSTFGGRLSGNGSLTKQGYGTLTLTAPQTYGGATVISGGILQLAPLGTGTQSGSLPASSPVTISNAATLDVTNLQETVLSLSSTDGMGSQVLLGSGALTIANTTGRSTTFDGQISGGSGALIVQGGRLTLTGQNTYSGVTEILGGGTLQLATGANGQDGSIDSTGLVSDFGSMVFNFIDNRTVAYPVTGPGALRQAGTGILTLTATNSYIGGTTINGGTLQLGDGTSGDDGSIAGTSGVTNNGALAFDLAGSQTVSYRISGSGSLIMVGAGKLTLSGSNTYSGGTFVEAGKLVVANNAAIAGGSSLTVGNASLFPAPPAPSQAASPVAVAPVPEPGTLALLAAACTACGWSMWRRKKPWSARNSNSHGGNARPRICAGKSTDFAGWEY